MHARSTVLGILSLLALGCGEDDQGISFSKDIAPIFEGRCNICHHPTSAVGHEFAVAFDPERGVVNRENSWAADHPSPYELIVDPGNPANSSLVAKVGETPIDPAVDGNNMPYAVPYLEDADIAKVEAWILAGANDDATFGDVATLFGTEITLGRASGSCTYCHYPDSPTGLSVLDVFDPVEGMVGVEASSGGTLVVPGDPANSVLIKRLRGEDGARMPLHFTPLSPEEVQRIVDWIVIGAPNN